MQMRDLAPGVPFICALSRGSVELSFPLLELFFASGILASLVGFFRFKKRYVRWLSLMALIVPLLITVSHVLLGWTQKVYDAAGCTGTAMKGLSCPSMDGWVRIAIFHDIAMLISMAFIGFGLFFFVLLLLLPDNL